MFFYRCGFITPKVCVNPAFQVHTYQISTIQTKVVFAPPGIVPRSCTWVPGALLVWGPSNTFQTFLSVCTLISISQNMDYECIKMWFLGPRAVWYP